MRDTADSARRVPPDVLEGGAAREVQFVVQAISSFSTSRSTGKPLSRGVARGRGAGEGRAGGLPCAVFACKLFQEHGLVQSREEDIYDHGKAVTLAVAGLPALAADEADPPIALTRSLWTWIESVAGLPSRSTPDAWSASEAMAETDLEWGRPI